MEVFVLLFDACTRKKKSLISIPSPDISKDVWTFLTSSPSKTNGPRRRPMSYIKSVLNDAFLAAEEEARLMDQNMPDDTVYTNSNSLKDR